MADERMSTPGVIGASPEAERRRQGLSELELGREGDFDDPSREWRRLFSELLGTFLLVLVGAGGAVAQNSHASALRTALLFGFLGREYFEQ